MNGKKSSGNETQFSKSRFAILEKLHKLRNWIKLLFLPDVAKRSSASELSDLGKYPLRLAEWEIENIKMMGENSQHFPLLSHVVEYIKFDIPIINILKILKDYKDGKYENEKQYENDLRIAKIKYDNLFANYVNNHPNRIGKKKFILKDEV